MEECVSVLIVVTFNLAYKEMFTVTGKKKLAVIC